MSIADLTDEERKIVVLEWIENKRLRFFQNWTKVNVYRKDDKIVHKWHGSNIGFPFHIKERPIEKLDYLIDYHFKKLINKS